MPRKINDSTLARSHATPGSRINPFKPDIKFDIDEDWPVDLFGEKGAGTKATVSEATFHLDAEEVRSLFEAAAPKIAPPAEGEAEPEPVTLPDDASVTVSRSYDQKRDYHFSGMPALDAQPAEAWMNAALPKFVYVRDYETIETTSELPALVQKYFNGSPNGNWAALSPQE